MPVSLASSRALFPLRVKYAKVTLFIPVQASTQLSELKAHVLQALIATRQSPPQGVADTFMDLDAVNDLGFFHGAESSSATSATLSAVGADASATGAVAVHTGAGEMTFENVEERTGKPDTVGQVGWKDEVNNVTYLGFKYRGDKTVSQPHVQIPSLMDDEDEEDEGEELGDDIPIPKFNEAGEEVG
ncbi:hypothetical protein K437DRAFT_105986 [Tilletiaria anomala UBC 951]|uniref:Uncharacterized protein n=1 Tax=Tilletiaria anomala (strain ATCC 24038 / CBS 436.72 / UBC 951) TaxID=1037660 RepID=A0A066W747_TILAU|nr:uncharacterized protein K437DRAFT_105986 [Tilletiaria anomala UBC 951]KDN46620.1 hypothetical protein K437DRAFT_105986 [Tilletiaria anomala UBC 951]